MTEDDENWWSSSGSITADSSMNSQSMSHTLSSGSVSFMTSSMNSPSGAQPIPTGKPDPSNTPTNTRSDTHFNTLSNISSVVSSSSTTFSPTTIAVTVISPSTTFISSSVSLVPVNSPTNGVGNIESIVGTSTCIGQGIDVTATGVVATTVLCSIVGLLLWLLFGYLRPKYRQIYSVREWFLPPELRPKPLKKTFWAFLWPSVPLVPSVPNDISAYSNGRDPKADAALFPSDEELSQRIVWHAFLVVLAWSILGLGGALPLYLVGTPCVADSTPAVKFGGQYSTLQDLSVIRLLNLLEKRDIGNTPDSAGQFHLGGLSRRATVNGKDVTRNTEVRLIVLAVLVVAVAAIPALFKLLREFTRLVNYRKRWMEVKCDGIDMAWLSKTNARGFDGWGEGQLKDYIIKIGLSKGFKNSDNSSDGLAGVGAYGRRAGQRSNTRTTQDESSPEVGEDDVRAEVDIQGLFTVADTSRLSILVDERDIILHNLEVAETQYVNSFRLSTPQPSVLDFEASSEPPQPVVSPSNTLKDRISRPKALGGSNARRMQPRRRRVYTPGAAPTSYVAPSSYYKLRDVRGVGKMSPNATEDSLAQRIGQRVIGSRFQEIHRDSFAFGRLPLGSLVRPDNQTGVLGPVSFSQDQLLHGPNDPSSGNEAETETLSEQPNYDIGNTTSWFRGTSGRYSAAGPSTVEEETERTQSPLMSEELGVHPRPLRDQTPLSTERRSTFPMRQKTVQTEADVEAMPPPHLRLQPQQPFVRPVSGMDHDDLGIVYGNIREWRSRLKAINVEIADAQAENYNFIADGVNVKGWLLVGRGLRFLPGVEMIEGRSKEDIRYDELQDPQGKLGNVAFWTVVGMVAILLGASLIAVSGLAVITGPDVAHFLSFLQPLGNNNNIGTALATTLAPALAASLFIALALCAIHYAARFSGSVSVTVARVTAFKAIFSILVVVCSLWLIACGSMLFALEAIDSSSQRTQMVATGSVNFAAFLLVLVINVAIISPALLMLQPLRLWRLLRRERKAVTPRERFRALYPRVYDPTYATACCILAVTFAATFSLIFPIIGPPVCLLLFLTLIAHRYLIGYVYARTHVGYTGGLLQIWLLRRFANLISLQPLLLGLILLTRRLWILGGVLVGAAVVIAVGAESYTWHKLRLPEVKSLSPITQDSLARFKSAALPEKTQAPSEEPSLMSSPRRGTLPRGSMASVLEMMSLTLAVMPSSSKSRAPVPLQTEDLDDLTATEQAARTNPTAPPRLPPLPFTTHSEEMQGILYAPELIAPPPIIWLPNDRSGVAQSEAIDLFRYHDLKTTLDLSPADAIPRPSNDSRRDNSATT